jgi:hypothetical protein
MMSSTEWACLFLSHVSCTRSAVWRRAVELLGTLTVPGEWSIVLALHYSRTVAACLHALYALTALMSGTLEMCVGVGVGNMRA